MQEVHAYEVPQMPLNSLDAVLRQLAHLTGLALSMECGAFPSALVGLSQLQWLYLRSGWECEAPALPSGAWTGSLRCLALVADVAERSVPQLAAATRLSHLSLLDLPAKSTSLQQLSEWAAFWHWVATHPPLRRLDMREQGGDYSGMVPTELLEAGMQLAINRPHLQLVVMEDEGSWPLDELRCMSPAHDM